MTLGVVEVHGLADEGRQLATCAARLLGLAEIEEQFQVRFHEGQLAQAEPELRAAHAKEWAPKVHVLLHFVKAQLGSKV